jgi:hypothetical protein
MIASLISIVLCILATCTSAFALGSQSSSIENPAHPDPFRKIVFKASGAGRPTPQDSRIHRKSLPNFEIIFSVAANFDSNLHFNEGMSASSIIGKFRELLEGNPYITMAALIYRRDTQECFLLKTPEHRGPIFLILDQTDNGYEVIPAVIHLVNNSYQTLKVVSFHVQPSHLFLGFPNNFNQAWGNDGLFLESSGWFVELPEGESEVQHTFSCRLQYKTANINTEIVFARLGDAHNATFSEENPWEVKEEEVQEGPSMVSCSPLHSEHHQMEMAPPSQLLPIQLQHYPAPPPLLHQWIPEARRREAITVELFWTAFFVSALGMMWAVAFTDLVPILGRRLWEMVKASFDLAYRAISLLHPETFTALLVRLGLKTAAKLA